MEVGLIPGDFVLDGDPAPYPKRGGAPLNFRPTSFVAKRLHGSRWHLVQRAYMTLCLMWTQLPPEKRAHPPSPNFGPCLLWPNGWMDEDAAWYGSRPWPRPQWTRRGPSSRERGIAATLFSACVYCGQVAHLSYCWALVDSAYVFIPVSLSRIITTLNVMGVCSCTLDLTKAD